MRRFVIAPPPATSTAAGTLIQRRWDDPSLAAEVAPPAAVTGAADLRWLWTNAGGPYHEPRAGDGEPNRSAGSRCLRDASC